MNLMHGLTRRLAPTLAIGMLAALLPLSQASAEEIYTRSAAGVVDVAPDGTVVALELESDLGEAQAGYEAMMRQWRFNPIHTADGEPVDRTVRVTMRVDLYATRQDDGSLTMSTGRPTFRPLDDPDHERRVHGIEFFPAPRYPQQAAANGYEAQVLLLVQVAPDGSVSKVGARSAALLNRPAEGGAARHVRPFVQAARQAAGRIRFAQSEEAREVLLPIRFAFRDRDENAWSRIVFVPRAQDDWVEAALADSDAGVEDFDATGQPVDTRIALVTEIDDPWL